MPGLKCKGLREKGKFLFVLEKSIKLILRNREYFLKEEILPISIPISYIQLLILETGMQKYFL